MVHFIQELITVLEKSLLGEWQLSNRCEILYVSLLTLFLSLVG
jgi:hypothetical protein